MFHVVKFRKRENSYIWSFNTRADIIQHIKLNQFQSTAIIVQRVRLVCIEMIEVFCYLQVPWAQALALVSALVWGCKQ